MNPRSWLVYAILFGHALSVLLPTASPREGDMVTLSSKLSNPGHVSAITANTSSSHNGSDVTLIPLNNASHPLSDYSASTYDIPFDYNLPVTTASAPQCNDTIYGSNLDRHSCFDAWRNMGLTPERESWGPRGPGRKFQHKLPQRWSSGRSALAIGTCYRSKQHG